MSWKQTKILLTCFLYMKTIKSALSLYATFVELFVLVSMLLLMWYLIPYCGFQVCIQLNPFINLFLVFFLRWFKVLCLFTCSLFSVFYLGNSFFNFFIYLFLHQFIGAKVSLFLWFHLFLFHFSFFLISSIVYLNIFYCSFMPL